MTSIAELMKAQSNRQTTQNVRYSFLKIATGSRSFPTLITFHVDKEHSTKLAMGLNAAAYLHNLNIHLSHI